MNPENSKPAESGASVPKHFWITRREWDQEPGTCAVKLGAIAAAILVVGSAAPWVAFGAGLVIVAKAVKS